MLGMPLTKTVTRAGPGAKPLTGRVVRAVSLKALVGSQPI